jgi:hypothetical protein
MLRLRFEIGYIYFIIAIVDFILKENGGSSVSIENRRTGWTTGVQFLAGAAILSPRHRVQPMGTGRSSPGSKAAGA